MDEWIGGCKSSVEDCLQQAKNKDIMELRRLL
jgi:hypothetical protein